MEIEIPRGREYRIEVPYGKKVRLTVTSGKAETMGLELLNDKLHIFSDTRASIFTYTGAKIRLDGDMDLHYPALHAMSPQVLAVFDEMHKSENFSRKMMVVGRGRSTFCATMANYTIRARRKLTFLEIDPGRGNIFPGALSGMTVDQLVDWSEHFKLNNPLCLFYGNTEIENQELYDMQIDALLDAMSTRGAEEFQLILAPELPSDGLNNLAKKFGVDVVIVVGDERLFHRLNLVVPKRFVENTAYVAHEHVAKSVSRYFNGADNIYSPCSFGIKTRVEVVRVGEEYLAPESALPLGATRKVEKTAINKVEMAENHILAVSEAKTEDAIAVSPVICFLVCQDAAKMKVLCPQASLPKCQYLLQGNVKFFDY